MNIEIRRIASSDSDIVIDLFNKYRIFYTKPSNIEVAKSFIQARLDKNESVIFVATIKDGNKVVPVGFTQLYPKFSSLKVVKIWILNDLYVEAEYRKQGIGESLINIALEFAKEDQASHVELSTAIDNYTAQSLYETMGFEKQELSTSFFNYKIDLPYLKDGR